MLRYAFLVLEEHPYGREMLRTLLERGSCPGLVVEEVSDVADEERHKFLTRIAGQPIPPTIAELTAEHGVPLRRVDNHNSTACRDLLLAFDPDLVVLGGTRILGSIILDVLPRGIVNAHPGLLPELRGSSSVAWALYKNLPIGATTHYVEAGIDTGAIILRRRLSVSRGETYEQIVRQVLTLSGELMAETVSLFQGGQAAGRRQDTSTGVTLRVIPPDLLEEAKAGLSSGQYLHFEE